MTSARTAPSRRSGRTAKGLPNPSRELALTVRVGESDGTLDKLTALSLVDSNTLADQLRAAVTSYIETRLASPSLPAEIAEAEKRHRARTAILTDPAAVTPASTTAQPRIAGRALGLRTDQNTFDKLTALALVDDSPTTATQIRIAIEQYVARRLTDETLPRRIAAMSGRHTELMASLTG